MPDALRDGYMKEEPIEQNPSRSPSDTAKTKTEDLGDIRASLTMEDAQFIGKRVRKHDDAE